MAASICKVGLLGFGTVGASVAKALGAIGSPGLELKYVYNRGVARKQISAEAAFVGAGVVWTEDVDEVLGSDVDVVVELVGGVGPAKAWIERALRAGKHVVTANKQIIAFYGAELFALAAQHGVQLLHGAAVAGGVPVIPGMLQGLQGDFVTEVSGILNGTCNYILSRMEAGDRYADVLADAQRLGYAEADPTADVGGFDARAKLCILSRVVMHVQIDPEQVATQTIAAIDLGGGSVQQAFAVPVSEAAKAPEGYITQLSGGGRAYNVYVHRCVVDLKVSDQ